MGEQRARNIIKYQSSSFNSLGAGILESRTQNHDLTLQLWLPLLIFLMGSKIYTCLNRVGGVKVNAGCHVTLQIKSKQSITDSFEGNSTTVVFLMDLEIMVCASSQALSMKIKPLDLLNKWSHYWRIYFFPAHSWVFIFPNWKHTTQRK